MWPGIRPALDGSQNERSRLGLKALGNIVNNVLGMGDGHSVTRNDYDIFAVLKKRGKIACRDGSNLTLGFLGPLTTVPLSAPKPPAMTLKNWRFMPRT